MIKTALFGTSRCQNGTEWHLFSITGPSCIFSQSSTETVQGHHPLSNDHPLKTAAAPFRQLIFGSGYSRCHAVIYHSDYGNANQFWKNSALSCFQPDAGVSFPDKRCRMTDFSIQKWTNDPCFRTPLSGHLSSNVRVRFKEIRFYIPRFGVRPPPPAGGRPKTGAKNTKPSSPPRFFRIGGFGK